MVDLSSSFVVGVGAIFVVLLAVIIFGSRGAATVEKAVNKPKREKKPKKEKAAKESKGKGRKDANQGGNKNQNKGPVEQAKKYVIDTVAEAKAETREVLEFLKGKDLGEIRKAMTQEEKKAQKAKKGAKEEENVFAQPSRAISEHEAVGFEEVKVKPKKEKAEKVVEEKKEGKKKRLYKETEAEAAEKAKAKADFEAREAERAARKLRKERGEPEPPRERKPRPEGEEGEEKRERRQRKPRLDEEGNPLPEEPRAPRYPTAEETIAATSKGYREVGLDDLLNAIGKTYTPTPVSAAPKQQTTGRRPQGVDSVFTPLTQLPKWGTKSHPEDPKPALFHLLAYFTAKELGRLASVNQLLRSAINGTTDAAHVNKRYGANLWNELVRVDFGKTTKGTGNSGGRSAYRAAQQAAAKAKAPKKEKAPKATKEEAEQ